MLQTENHCKTLYDSCTYKSLIMLDEQHPKGRLRNIEWNETERK